MKEDFHFSIDGSWLTEFAREHWAGDNQPYAIRLLADALPTMPENDRMDVLMGRQRLEGVNDVHLIPDDATHDRHGRKLPTVAEALTAAQVAVKAACAERDDALTDLTDQKVRVSSPFGRIELPISWTQVYGRLDPRRGLKKDLTWDEVEQRFPDAVEAAKDQAETRRQLDAERRAANKANRDGEKPLYYQGIKVSPDYTRELRTKWAAEGKDDSGRSPEPPPKPTPDKQLESQNGWLSPEGKFYGCEYSGHDDLAHRLGYEVKVIERTWCRLREGSAGIDFHVSAPQRGVTQAQFNTIEKWCAKHSFKMPRHLEII